MRITEDVNVPATSVCGRGNVEQLDPSVGCHVSGSSFGHVAIPGPIEHGGSPELEVEAGRDEQISPPNRQCEARLRTHEMCVLIRRRNGADIDLRTANLLDQICVDGERGYDSDGIRLCGTFCHR